MAQPPKGGLVRGHDKLIHGSCAIYFPGGVTPPPPPQKKQTTICGYEKKNPPQADAEEDRNKLLDRIQQLADELQNVLDRSVGVSGRADIHNGGVISWKIPIYIYTLTENLWVSLGVIKPVNWSYGPFVIVEANFVW